MVDEVPVVKALIKDEKGRLLMLKKSSQYDWMADKWEQPGGKIEEDEDRFEAARREIETETCLEVEDFEDLVRIEIEDKEEKVNCYVVFTDDFSGEVELSDEHQDSKWILRQEALDLDWHRNAEYILPVIEYLEEYREGERNYGEEDEIDVVKLLIRNGEGKFLAVQKTPKVKVSSGESYPLYGRMSGKWELPGGKFKSSDNRFDAARREIKEELGIKLENLKDAVREEIEEENSVNTWILFTEDFWGEIEISSEHEDYRWVKPDEYAELNWHQDAGYGLPPMRHLKDYLQ
jgi:8-oxo-dGTP diphosphatase